VNGALAVSIGFGHAATRDLTRVGLTLAPRRRSGRGALVATVLVAAAFAAGLATGELLRESAPAVVVRAPAAPTAELVQLRQQLEQARMGLRVADARSQELEKQIDALNQKLAESQDELTFFRKAREGKKH
jgi:septal ring factor EnvC (AmiA/AmiB activator)